MKEKFPVYDICNLSDFKDEDILISRFAPYLARHKNLQLPHRHNFYHLVMFTQGSGNHAIDFQSFDVNPYQIYFMVPGQVHSWDFRGNIDGYVVNFSVPFFQEFLYRADYLEQFPFFNGTVKDKVINIAHDHQQQIKQLFEQIILETEAHGRLTKDMVRLLMLQMFILLARLSLLNHPLPEKSVYNYTLLKNFRQLVDKNFATLRLPREYAEQLYITPNHLNALCTDVLGISAGEVIRNRIILEAKRLLVNFDMNINQIADLLNFQDNSYFTKFFKKQTGSTPEQFRKEIKYKHHE